MTHSADTQRFLDLAAALDAQPVPSIRYVLIGGRLHDVLTLAQSKGPLTLLDLFPTLKVKPT